MTAPRLERRAPGVLDALPATLHPVLRRVYAARGVSGDELELGFRQLLPPSGLHGIAQATQLIVDAIRTDAPIVIAGDYDCDGATGVAVAVSGLKALGARHVDYVVPDRFRMGYGLSPALAELAAATGARLLITVDSGIVSNTGVAHAQSLGLRVLITDHHLAGSELPTAEAIVNPNQPACGFPSKNLAGVGVMFYLLLAVRAQLRIDGAFAVRDEPNLAELLDLVAIGTVADVVKLDRNNRILVQQGLARIRAGRARPGVLALLQVASREPSRLSASDLGFVLGPRINAAGRLDDIRTGIECLLATDSTVAAGLAQQLDRFNRERREIETQMREDALLLIEDSDATGVCVFQDDWHEGVVGLVASKVKDKLHRPTIAFARAQEGGLLKGSGRSIPGLHLRDALVLLDTRYPGLLQRYGGHAMAAGMTIAEADYDAFAAAYDAICAELLDADALDRIVHTDGELVNDELGLATAHALEQAGPWGQGFAEPLFDGVFRVIDQRVLKDTHVKYRLEHPQLGVPLPAIHFGGIEQLRRSGRIRICYRLGINRWRDAENLELFVVDVIDA